MFFMLIGGNFQSFQYFNFETDFLENIFFKKREYRILVVSIPYKTAISEANVKTNRKNRVLAVTT